MKITEARLRGRIQRWFDQAFVPALAEVLEGEDVHARMSIAMDINGATHYVEISMKSTKEALEGCTERAGAR